jgi:hypothetical protein
LAGVVVLAGDVAVGPRGLDWIRQRYPDRPVVYVLGNHEFYHHYNLLSLPVTIPAIWAGRTVNHRLPADRFRKYVYIGLIIIGSVLAIQSG